MISEWTHTPPGTALGRHIVGPALAALMISALSADALSAASSFIVVKLGSTPTYSSAYGRVNKQLTVLQSRRAGHTGRAKCRSEAAIQWLADQSKETASWSVTPSQRQRNDALAAELRHELAAQSALQPCNRYVSRRK